MECIISADESKILAILQEGLPKSPTPLEDMGALAGVRTNDLLQILRKWKTQGKLRRIGAIVNHFRAGLGAGAMVAWKVESERVEEVGVMLAGYREISHAYEREACEIWPYNIYTMVHAVGAEELGRTIERMSKACGVAKYRVLVTEKELKKTAPRYITRGAP
jgi:DNA-binding Lrp family transcriptional regulator